MIILNQFLNIMISMKLLSKKKIRFKSVSRFFSLSFITFIFLIQSCSTIEKPMVNVQHLHDNWSFSAVDTLHFYSAKIPGTIHTDLFENKLIPDPFEGCNEKQLQWIGNQDWVYRTSFNVDSEVFDNQQVSIVFEGLDTYASVSLNGHLLFSSNNMFRTWEADCKQFLKKQGNNLEIVFSSALQKYKADSLAAGHFLPGGKWMYARKAAYHFGWDWGPVFITAGIWKPVYLKGWDKILPRDFYLKTTQLSEEKATLNLSFELDATDGAEAEIVLKHIDSGKEELKKDFEVTKGQTNYSFDFEIHNPKLWWTHDLGEPYLYEWQVEIKTSQGEVFQKNLSFGIRTIELVQEPDSAGASFFMKLNGVPLFAKGANYIPQHSFLTEISDSSYRALLDDAVFSNMNMLRVWGGGVYEKELFYELCDQKGILVWQDFMFACAMYPGDEAFLMNVKKEAEEQVKRLRNHACLALWCGNNEVDEGWHNWGWQKQYAMDQSTQDIIWNDYTQLFQRLLPDVVNALDHGKAYISSSPQNGWGRKESMTEGDSHYWGVWWGKEPFEKYQEKVPRFMSEFGFQAMPAIATIRSFQDKAADTLYSPSLRCHQKHPTGFETLSTYLKYEYLEANDLESLIYATQLIQAQGIGMAIEAQRSAKPYCMGSLYWQLNDVWPVTSWSGIDAQGNWKALQYRIKEVFDDVLVSVLKSNDSLHISLISDRRDIVNGSLKVDLVSFDGKRDGLYTKKVSITSEKAMRVFSLRTSDLTPENHLDQSFIEVCFTTDEGNIYKDTQFLLPFGLLKLPEVLPEIEINKVENGFSVKLTATAYTAFNQLYLTESNGHFIDNHFHLQAGESRTIFCSSLLSLNDFKNQLRVYNLNKLIHSGKTNSVNKKP